MGSTAVRLANRFLLIFLFLRDFYPGFRSFLTMAATSVDKAIRRHDHDTDVQFAIDETSEDSVADLQVYMSSSVGLYFVLLCTVRVCLSLVLGRRRRKTVA
jgi:hypothetical protein